MTKRFRSARILAAIAIPPLVATVLAGGIAMLTGGERRCFERLDLGTPGMMCTKMLFEPFLFVGVLLLHLLVLCPLGLWARRTRVRRQSLAGALCVVGLVLGVRDARWYLTAKDIPDALFVFIQVAIPVIVWGLLTVGLFSASSGSGETQTPAA